MKDKLKDISEITYSREMYEAKPRLFVSAFVYILLFIILVSLIWTYFSEIDIVARGNGVVRPSKNINTIRIEYAGKLKDVRVNEGQNVKKGDILYIIEHEDLVLKKDEIVQKSEDIENKLLSLKEYKKGIEEGETSFTEGEYANYYKTKFDDYKANLEYLNYQSETAKLNLAKGNRSDNISTQLGVLRNDYNLMSSLKNSINQNKNMLSDSGYIQKYENYKYNVIDFENQIEYLENNYDKISQLYEAGMVSKKEYEESKKSVSDKKAEYNKYKTGYMANLEENIAATKKQIKQYETSLKDERLTGVMLNNEKENGASMIEKYRLGALVNTTDEIEAYENTLDSYKTELETIDLKINEAVIKSPIDGKINLLVEASTGDYITFGTELVTIIPENEVGYIVDIALPNREVSGISEGDAVKFKFSALPYKEYGEFTGVIYNISTDAKVDKTGTSYYLLKAKLEDNEGVSYKGEIRSIKVGMSCEAHIIKERKKVLYFLLEKINLRD